MNTYICGTYDGKDYAMVHHVGPMEAVEKTYAAMKHGAETSGLDASTLALLGPEDYESFGGHVEVCDRFLEFMKARRLKK